MTGKRVAIIGAGSSGLAAAWSLRGLPVEVEVFEKSRGVSGRAASRTRHGVRFDHGANYFKIDSPPIEQLITRELPTDDLVQIAGDVWTFDNSDIISPGDPSLNAVPKWTYTSGISTLGKLLAEAAETPIHHSTHIDGLKPLDGGWRLLDSEKNALGDFDAVLLTPPSPQCGALLEAGEVSTAIGSQVIDTLNGTEFHRQFSIILSADGEISRPGDFFALINSDRKHDIAWLSFENDKPGHVPEGETVIVVQMSPDWSREHFEDDPDSVIAEAERKAAHLLQCDWSLRWADRQRWKFAHPASRADQEILRSAENEGLFFAGDALVGKGRIPRAIETGFEAAARIRGRLNL